MSKYLTPEDGRALLEGGVQPLGENRADDLVAKADPKTSPTGSSIGPLLAPYSPLPN